MDQDVIALTRALLSFNTINPPGDEVECLSWLASFLRDTGFEVKLQHFGERRCNLIATLAGSAPGKPLAFTGHLDTVPLGNAQWKFDPFAGEIADGKLYGRGSSDMKAAIAAFTVACIHCQTKIVQNSGVMLILTGGEETGCDGARAMINDPSLTLTQPGALIVGEPTDNYPMVGHKGALWLRCATHGKTAHGAMPELGINAIYLAADAIGKIRHFDPGPPHPLMKKPTLNVGTFQGGLNINSVPDKASFDVDMRTDPTLAHSTLTSRLQLHLSDVVTIETLVDLPAVLTERQNPWVQSVFAHCQPLHQAKVEAKIVPYFTDAALLVDALGNPPCLILGPGEPSMAHQTDEYCQVSRLQESVALYQQIIEDYYLLIDKGVL
jgi:succinyl-diaminopimelate desuccinylase